MRIYVRTIRVEDASGAQFRMHEFVGRRTFFWISRDEPEFELDTGEPARVVDDNTFQLTSTGEHLTRL